MTKKEQIALLKQGIIEKQKEKRLVEQVLARVQTIISTDELYRGKQGEPGEKPAYRVDYLTPDELEALKAELKPADGLPGKDGKDANTQDIIKELLANEVFLLYTKAKNPPTAGQVARELIDNETFLDKVKGEKGDKGDIPNHEWKGTKLRFEKPNGGWGKWVDLKGFTAVVQQSGSGSGSTTGGTTSGDFLGLSDTPDSYAGQGGKVVAVKADVSGLEFIVPTAGAETDPVFGAWLLSPIITGNFTVEDLLITTKKIVLNNSLSGVRLEGHAGNLYLTTRDALDGAERVYLNMGFDGDYALAYKYWEWQNASYQTAHIIDPNNGVVLNEQGADIDFRVESDTETHMLFVDAGNNRVGIGTDTPASTLDVDGTITSKRINIINNNNLVFWTADATPIQLFDIYASGNNAIALAGFGGGQAILDVASANGGNFEFPVGVGGTLALTTDLPDISLLVPYTGATGDVNLATNDLTFTGGGKIILGLADTDEVTISSVAGHMLGIAGSAPSVIATINPELLTVSRQFDLPDQAGTFALISDIPVIPKTQIGLTIDGGGSAITTGLKGFGRVPRTGTISGWTILADQVGDIVVDVQLSSFAGFPTTASIAGTEKPTLSTAQSNEDIALTTWTTAVTEGDIISYTVDSVATVTRVNLFIHIT